MIDGFEAVEFNLTDANLSAISSRDGEVSAANERIAQYNRAVCGFPVDGGDGGASGDSGSLEQTITALVASGCSESDATCIAAGLGGERLSFQIDPEADALAAILGCCAVRGSGS